MFSDQNKPFPLIEQEDNKLISTYGDIRFYPKGKTIIYEGEDSDAIYVIQSGKVKVFVSNEDGKEAILSIQGPGECFGELASITREPRSASVVALEQTYLSVVSKANFERCLTDNPGLVFKLVGTLSHRIRILTETVKSLALQDVYNRLIRKLMEYAVKQADYWVIEERFTDQELANMIGATREMVNRIMNDLKKNHYIQKQRQQLYILRQPPAHWCNLHPGRT